MNSDKDKTGTKVKILIVEDSPTQAAELQFLLEQNNYSASIAKNGIEALTFLKKSKPRLVISDILMPEMDGFELCRNITTDENFKNIPVILLTTLSEPEDIIRGLEIGAHNFVTKPYDKEFLLARINNVLANYDIRQKAFSEMGIWIIFS